MKISIGCYLIKVESLELQQDYLAVGAPKSLSGIKSFSS